MTIKVTVLEKAKGVIESANFPATVQVGTFATWDAVAHNVGSTGLLGMGIVNITGNPGEIILKVNEEEVTIPQGTYMRYYYPTSVPYCTRLVQDGKVKFLATGTYTIKVWGMHQEDGKWYYDDEKSFSVVVTEEIVEASFWETLKKFAKENPIVVAIGVGSAIGGAIVWQKKSEE